MILAGDIGGTKTNLALFEEEEGNYRYTHLATFSSREYPDLTTILREFLHGANLPTPSAASLAIAGPVIHGVCKTTNLPWIVDSQALASELGIPQVFLLNDLEANAWAIEILAPENLFNLNPGFKNSPGNRAVVSPGTGLGEAGLYWDGSKYHPFACEGGHCEFGPRGELQLDLCRYLHKKYGHASYERVLSGPGLHEAYLFLKEITQRQEPEWLKEEMREQDPSKVIAQNALNRKSELCNDALDLFVSILGSEAANCVLKFMALGGIYLGGGIPPKILPKLQEPLFLEGFFDKGRFKGLLQTVPINVILDDKASLKGAAHFCRTKSTI